MANICLVIFAWLSLGLAEKNDIGQQACDVKSGADDSCLKDVTEDLTEEMTAESSDVACAVQATVHVKKHLHNQAATSQVLTESDSSIEANVEYPATVLQGGEDKNACKKFLRAARKADSATEAADLEAKYTECIDLCCNCQKGVAEAENLPTDMTCTEFSEAKAVLEGVTNLSNPDKIEACIDCNHFLKENADISKCKGANCYGKMIKSCTKVQVGCDGDDDAASLSLLENDLAQHEEFDASMEGKDNCN